MWRLKGGVKDGSKKNLSGNHSWMVDRLKRWSAVTALVSRVKSDPRSCRTVQTQIHIGLRRRRKMGEIDLATIVLLDSV